MALQNGVATKEARKDLQERYAPETIIREEPVRKRPKASGRVGREPKPPKPTLAEEIVKWQTRLHDDAHRVVVDDYLLKQRRITKAIAITAELGVDERWSMKLPVYDAQRKSILNVRSHAFTRQALESGSPKMRGLGGKGVQLYPLWMVDMKSRRRVLTEGEMDCLCLHSLGEREAVTTTGGAGSYSWSMLEPVIPVGPGSEVILCFDNDKAGRNLVAPKNLPETLVSRGVETVRVVEIPQSFGKDVCDWALKMEIEELPMAWQMLVTQAKVFTRNRNSAADLIAVDGCLLDVNSIDKIIAPFTGRLKAEGIDRVFGQESHDTRVFTFLLTHRNGQAIEVRHRHGDRLIDSIQSCPDAGGEWTYEARHDDRVFVWLAHEGGDHVVRRDTGFFLGFDNAEGQTFRYYTPDAIFSPDGMTENTEILMNAPDPWSARFNIPRPDREKATKAISALVDDFVPCHLPIVTLPMLATAFLAPVRELIAPNEPRFNVLVHGESGSGKTSRVRVLQNLFGYFPTDNELLSWESTIKTVSHLSAGVGNVLVVADELRYQEMSRLEQTEILRFLQGSSQGIGRGRMTPEGNVILPPKPKSILVVTMETLPLESHSQLARALVLGVPRIEILGSDYQIHYESLLKKLRILPHAMGAWIDWVIAGPHSGTLLGEAQAWADATVFEVAADIAPTWKRKSNGPRVIQRLRAISISLGLWLRFACEQANVSAATRLTIETIWKDEVLTDMMGKSFRVLEETSTHGVFLDALTAALQSGAFDLRDETKTTNQLVPSWASTNSRTVGFIVKAEPDDDHACLWLGGTRVRVGLTSAASAVEGRDQKKASWNHTRQYLQNNGMATDDSRRIGNYRAMWLSKEAASRLLLPFM